MCLGGGGLSVIYIFSLFSGNSKEAECQEISFDLMNRVQGMDEKVKKLET